MKLVTHSSLLISILQIVFILLYFSSCIETSELSDNLPRTQKRSRVRHSSSGSRTSHEESSVAAFMNLSSDITIPIKSNSNISNSDEIFPLVMLSHQKRRQRRPKPNRKPSRVGLSSAKDVGLDRFEHEMAVGLPIKPNPNITEIVFPLAMLNSRPRNHQKKQNARFLGPSNKPSSSSRRQLNPSPRPNNGKQQLGLNKLKSELADDEKQDDREINRRRIRQYQRWLNFRLQSQLKLKSIPQLKRSEKLKHSAEDFAKISPLKREKVKNLEIETGNKNENNKPAAYDRSKHLGISMMLKSSQPKVVVTKASLLKKDWCKTWEMKQKIQEPGCLGQTTVNNFCYGQCNSFYIPVTSGKTDDFLAGFLVKNNTGNAVTNKKTGAFQSCAFCRPQKFHWESVVLSCPGLTPPFRTKRILKIDKCKCRGQ